MIIEAGGLPQLGEILHASSVVARCVQYLVYRADSPNVLRVDPRFSWEVRVITNWQEVHYQRDCPYQYPNTGKPSRY